MVDRGGFEPTEDRSPWVYSPLRLTTLLSVHIVFYGGQWRNWTFRRASPLILWQWFYRPPTGTPPLIYNQIKNLRSYGFAPWNLRRLILYFTLWFLLGTITHTWIWGISTIRGCHYEVFHMNLVVSSEIKWFVFESTDIISICWKKSNLFSKKSFLSTYY